MFKLLKVSGNSLQPAFQDGDFVLVSKIPYLFDSIRRGDIVVLRHRSYGTMIKIVDSVIPDRDEIRVVGIDDRSVDSREFGGVSKRQIVGKVIWHIKKRGNAR